MVHTCVKSLSYVSIPKRVSEALKRLLMGLLNALLTVSIPKRVSEALKLPRLPLVNIILPVSIPKRVSEALKPGDLLPTNKQDFQFQSLKGFQRL